LVGRQPHFKTQSAAPGKKVSKEESMARVLQDLLLTAAAQAPGKTAVYHGAESLTYEQVLGKSLSLSHALRRAGIRKGDRICLYLEKRLEKVISIFGIAIAGGVMVPIRRLAKPEQVLHIVNDSGAQALITTVSRLLELNSRMSQMPLLKTIIMIGSPQDCSAHNGVELIPWHGAMLCAEYNRDDAGVTERDLAAILYTSGSTGRPKGVVLSHHNIVAGAEKVSEYLKINRDDRILSILTFSFDYGLNQLTTAFLACAQLVLMDYVFAGDILRAVDKFKITGLAAVPTIWIQLLQSSWEKFGMTRLRYITNSGGTLPAVYVKEVRRRLPETDIYLMYGLTEAFRSTYLNPGLVDQHPESIGKAIPGEEIMVLAENGQQVAAGQVGELVHRGVLVSQGYWRAPDLTALRFRPNPLQAKEVSIPEMVVYSGDFVRMDENGLLFFVGRRDEMIKCAGNRISPTEVEEVIYGSKEVTDAVVLGIPHDINGQVVYAVVCLQNGKKLDPESLKKFCSSMMPPYMVPATIEIWDAMPRHENGKLDRSRIKKQVYHKLGISEKF
jgi:acyl-CoA ligase (AMP-forming) (exosortase A-associated)